MIRARVSHQFTAGEAHTSKCRLKSSGVPAHAILNAATPAEIVLTVTADAGACALTLAIAAVKTVSATEERTFGMDRDQS
jgi:hypothetical protein